MYGRAEVGVAFERQRVGVPMTACPLVVVGVAVDLTIMTVLVSVEPLFALLRHEVPLSCWLRLRRAAEPAAQRNAPVMITPASPASTVANDSLLTPGMA